MARKKINVARALMNELKDLMLRESTEMAGRGIYQRALSAVLNMGGSIDKTTVQLARVKELILLLDKEV